MLKSIYNPMSQVFKYLSISIVFMFIGYLFGLFLPNSFIYIANTFIGILMIGLLIIALFSKKHNTKKVFYEFCLSIYIYIWGINVTNYKIFCMQYRNTYIHVLNLYLDFINIFINLL